MEFIIPADSLERLQRLISNAEEETIEALYAQCAFDFLADCNLTELPEAAAPVIEQMVQYRYSQLNAEGLAGQSYSGMSESYLTDYPERLKRAMQRFRRIGLR